jgi:DNA-binding CsgD family transcriptional regulator
MALQEAHTSFNKPLCIDGPISNSVLNTIVGTFAITVTAKRTTDFLLDMEKKSILFQTERQLYSSEISIKDRQRNCKVLYWSLIPKNRVAALVTIKNNYLLYSPVLCSLQNQHFITADYPIIINKKEVFINQTFAPLVINSKGKIRIGMLSFSESSRQDIEALIILADGIIQEYDCETGRLKHAGHSIHLTEREKMILLRVKKGQTSKIIANELNLSVNTIKTHRLSICKKLAVNSMAEAIVVAEKHGYI